MPDRLTAPCPGCGKVLKYPAHAVNKSIRCRACGTIWKAPPVTTPELPIPSPPPDPSTESPPAVDPRHKRPVPVAPVAAAVLRSDPSIRSAEYPVAPAALTVNRGDISATPATLTIIAPPPRKKRAGGWSAWLIAFALVGLCVVIAGGAVWFVWTQWRAGTVSGDATNDQRAAVANSQSSNDQHLTHAPTHDFPRRILAIGVHNYVFANPTSYGLDSAGLIKRDFGKTVEKLASRFRVPESQVFELSDGAPPPKRRIPLKPIIEQTLERFLESSRKQDRIIVLLCAHTVEIEGKPYVVPLEGELNDAKTLIPLEDIVQKLAACRAQQKVLIADFNRYDRGRGVELPHGGKLAASTAQLLRNPPAGVQVWSACSEGEYSYEFDDYYEFREGGRTQGIKGGAFLCMFSVAFMQGLGGKIQTPNDPLPIESLAAKVNEYMRLFSEELGTTADDATDETDTHKSDKATDAKPARRAGQTPFLAGSPSGESIPFDPTEAPAPAVMIPSPQDVYGARMASVEQVRRLVEFISLPPIKEARKAASVVRIDEIWPFRADLLSEYQIHMTAEQIRKESERYPLRAAVLYALEEIRKLESGEGALPATLTEADRSDAAKASFARLQRGPARVMHVLEELTAALEKVEAQRESEPSKFWQATLDYVKAQIKARFIYVNEYTTAFGVVRRDRLPPLDPAKGHVGWRLASQETLSTNDNAVKEMRKELRKLYDTLIREHPNTPWAILAKRERNTALGLRWVPLARPKSEQIEMLSDSR